MANLQASQANLLEAGGSRSVEPGIDWTKGSTLLLISLLLYYSTKPDSAIMMPINTGTYAFSCIIAAPKAEC